MTQTNREPTNYIETQETRDIALLAYHMADKLGEDTITRDEFEAWAGKGRTPAQLAVEVDGLRNDVRELRAALTQTDEAWRLTADQTDDRLIAIEGRKGFLYQFKIAPELGWAIITAAGAVLLQGATDVEKVTDLRTWLVGIGAGLMRAVIGAVLAYRAGTVEKS